MGRSSKLHALKVFCWWMFLFLLILRMLSSVPGFAPHGLRPTLRVHLAAAQSRIWWFQHVILLCSPLGAEDVFTRHMFACWNQHVPVIFGEQAMIWYPILVHHPSPTENPRFNVALLGQFWGENHMPSSGQSAYFSYEYLQILSASLIYCFIMFHHSYRLPCGFTRLRAALCVPGGPHGDFFEAIEEAMKLGRKKHTARCIAMEICPLVN